MFSHSVILEKTTLDNTVTLYFKVSLLKCYYTLKYWVILIKYMYLLGVGLWLLVCIYAYLNVIKIASTCTSNKHTLPNLVSQHFIFQYVYLQCTNPKVLDYYMG